MGLAILVTITSLVISEINRQQSHIARRQHEQEVLILVRMAVQTDQKILEANGVNIRIEESKNKIVLFEGNKEILHVSKVKG
ncbi:TPA: competence type IV pilus minor pilin ComGE [Streptococcus agalactiae]